MKRSELIFKSVAGILFLLIVMGAGLFIPHKSFDYVQAWLYLGIFFISVLGFTIYLFWSDKRLLESRLSIGPVSEKKKSQKLIQSIAGLMFISIYILSSLDCYHKWSEVSLALSFIADAIILLAFIFLLCVFRENTFLGATIEVQENQKSNFDRAVWHYPPSDVHGRYVFNGVYTAGIGLMVGINPCIRFNRCNYFQSH